MRNITEKINNVSTLDAHDFNSMSSELENAALSADFTLDPPETTSDTNLNMLTQTVAAYASSPLYTDNGNANQYTLAAKNNLKTVAKYYDGMTASFEATNANTGASTLAIGGLAQKSIKDIDGNILPINSIRTGESTTVIFDSSNDYFLLQLKKRFITVSTVQELVRAPKSAGLILVQGFYTSGDGAEGLFYWDSAGDKATHNGGTIIDPDIIALPGETGWWTATGSGSGVWRRENVTLINVAWFGSKGNGTYDDTDPVAAAAAVAKSIIVATPLTIKNDLVLPITTSLTVFSGGTFDIAAGKTLTIDCSISAGNYQIISGDGLCIFGAGSCDKVPVHWRGVTSDNIDSTTAMQSLLVDIAASRVMTMSIADGSYLWTDTMSFTSGMSLVGPTQAKLLYTSSTSPDPNVRIKFEPTSQKNLFEIRRTAAEIGAGVFFGSKVNFSGLFIRGNTLAASGDSDYCFDFEQMIHLSFDGITILDFNFGFNCNQPIDNSYTRLKIYRIWDTCVVYPTAGTPTTDVWSQCYFGSAKNGVRIEDGLGLRFIDCLFEEIDEVGVELYKEAGAISFFDCYSENVPALTPTHGGTADSMFKVGHNGTTLPFKTALTVIGGVYAGVNGAVTKGTFLDVDYADEVKLSSVFATRYLNGIVATANIRDHGLSIFGISWQSVTTKLNAAAIAALAGMANFNDLNAGSMDPRIYANSIFTTSNITCALDILAGRKMAAAYSYTTATTTVTAATNVGVDVTALNTVIVDPTTSSVNISSFIGGVEHQIIDVVIMGTVAGRNANLSHIAGDVGKQDIYLSAMGLSNFAASYGGWRLRCDGTNWYEIGATP